MFFRHHYIHIIKKCKAKNIFFLIYFFVVFSVHILLHSTTNYDILYTYLVAGIVWVRYYSVLSNKWRKVLWKCHSLYGIMKIILSSVVKSISPAILQTSPQQHITPSSKQYSSWVFVILLIFGVYAKWQFIWSNFKEHILTQCALSFLCI